VHRRPILTRVFGVCVALALAWGGYYFAIERPRLVAAEEARVELGETLPKSLDAIYAAVVRDAKADDARTQAAQISSDGKAALARGDADGGRQAVAALGALDAKLVQTYDLMVVSRPDEDSGVFRVPSVNEGTRNYYLIVEAIGADGRAMAMDILSEEDGRSYKMKSWGVRVSEAVFEGVKRDKMDDGIVENRLVGHKLRGELQVRYTMPVMGGTITSW